MKPPPVDKPVHQRGRPCGQRPGLSLSSSSSATTNGSLGDYPIDNPRLLNTHNDLSRLAAAGNQRVIKAIPSPYDDYYLNESLTYITTGEAA